MDNILELTDLTKNFGGLLAVDKVNFALGHGELRCIIGPNGCGKTTLFNLISGHIKPTTGRVVFAGDDITNLPVFAIGRLGIGRKFQVPSVFDGLTVFQNMRAPYQARERVKMLSLAKADSKQRREIFHTLERVNLLDKVDELAMNLGHGQRQWLEIAMLLASRPRLMLLDEPTAGMTVSETRATADLIKEISGQTEIAILVIEHDLSFIRQLASPVTVMYKGSVFRQGSYQEIQADEEVRDIYLGRHE